MAKQFTVKAVADKYEMITQEDFQLHCKGYSGALENIPLHVADNLIKTKSPHLKLKKETKPAPVDNK